jgi:DNA-binding CsgD family transcriptional regulator
VKASDFVGRSAELGSLSACVESAVGGRARVAWIAGEAGSGKTALIRTLLDRLPPAFSLLQAEADQLAADMALAVARQLGPLRATDSFSAGLQLLQMCDEVRGGGPLAVVVEDLHWADLPSREALLTLARRLRDDPVLLLVTSRDDGPADGWERFVNDPDRCFLLRLGPLDVGEVADLARTRGVTLSRRDAERLHSHTTGHVLHVRTLLAELSAQQLSAGEGDLPAPRSLASTTIARVAGLPRESQMLGFALAVLNQRAALDLVGRIAGVPEPVPALEPLLATGFVTWWPSELSTPIAFTHPLFRAAVYSDLSPVVRQALHRASATALDPDAALAHRVAAAGHDDATLIDDLIDAARRDEDQGALSLAARNWLWVSSLTSHPRQGELAVLAATRLLVADGQNIRAQLLRDRVAKVSPGPLRSLLLGMLDWENGDAPGAESWFQDAVKLAAGDGSDRELRASALARLAALQVTQGRGSDALDSAGRAVALMPGDPAVESMAWGALVRAEGQLRGAAAGLELLSGRLEGESATVPASGVDLLVTRGTLRFYAGQNSAGATDLRVAIRLARQGAATAQLARAHVQLAQLLIILGDWDDAQVNARLGLSLVESEGQVWIEAQAHAALGSVLASRGEWEQARAHVNAAAEAAAVVGTNEARFTTRIARSTVARARDEPAEVVAALGPLAGTGESSSLTMFTALGWWPPLIEALIQTGNVEAADRHLGQLERAATDRRLDLGARIAGLRARLAVTLGELDQAASGFSRAVALLGPDDPMLDRALLHHRYGRLLRARGDRSAAVEQLRTAHELLSNAGARPYRQRVDIDLQACGVRSASPAYRSPLALTDREQDVATLVAKGLTNRQVAAELYVSNKAVEYHLRNIFGKLGITSRRDLPSRFPG